LLFFSFYCACNCFKILQRKGSDFHRKTKRAKGALGKEKKAQADACASSEVGKKAQADACASSEFQQIMAYTTA
jgi:hypothetical protein